MPGIPQTRARAAMTAQRWTTPALAQHIGVDRSHLAAVLKGRTAPCVEVRERLPIVLGIPLAQLLDEYLLARPYLGNYIGRRVTPVATATWPGQS